MIVARSNRGLCRSLTENTNLPFSRRCASIVGHVLPAKQGKRESDAVREYAAGLAHSQWRVFVHERINRSDAPELVTLYKL